MDAVVALAAVAEVGEDAALVAAVVEAVVGAEMDPLHRLVAVVVELGEVAYRREALWLENRARQVRLPTAERITKVTRSTQANVGPITRLALCDFDWGGARDFELGGRQ